MCRAGGPGNSLGTTVLVALAELRSQTLLYITCKIKMKITSIIF